MIFASGGSVRAISSRGGTRGSGGRGDALFQPVHDPRDAILQERFVEVDRLIEHDRILEVEPFELEDLGIQAL